MVTGTGRLLRVTPTEHPDLFWGLRGGRGGLGIVTALEFDLVPLRTVYGGALYFDGADAAGVLHTWRSWCQALPGTATSSVAVLQLPALPHVPPPLAGRTTVAVRLVSTGPPEEAAGLLAPLRAVASPVLDGMGVLPVADLDAVHADPKQGMPVTETAALLRDLPSGAVDELLRLAGPGSASPLVKVELRQLGGAVRRPGRHPSAVCGRDAGFQLVTIGLLVPPVAEAVTARGRELLAALSPWSTAGTLPTFAGGAHSYDAPTLDRLRSMVRSRDPERVLLAADPLFDGR